MEAICLTAMAKEPHRRYATAQTFAQDLRCWLRGERITARHMTAPERSWRWCRRNPLAATLLGTVACLVFLVAVVASIG